MLSVSRRPVATVCRARSWFAISACASSLLIGGAVATIGRYVDTGRIEQLPTARSELVQYLLIPYLAPEETRRIARAA